MSNMMYQRSRMDRKDKGKAVAVGSVAQQDHSRLPAQPAISRTGQQSHVTRVPNPYDPVFATRVEAGAKHTGIAATSSLTTAIPSAYPAAPPQGMVPGILSSGFQPSGISLCLARMKKNVTIESLEFSDFELTASEAYKFQEILKEEAILSTGLIMVIIEGWQEWFLDSFRQALPDFPLESLLYFGAQGGPAMLPLIDKKGGAYGESVELSCVVENINTDLAPIHIQKDEKLLDLGVAKAHRLPVVIWAREELSNDIFPSRPVLVMISGKGHKISMKMRQHYSDEENRRWNRLQGELAWIYLDSYFVLTKWDRVWSAIKENMRKRDEELQGQVHAPPILQQTRRLHREANMIISLREHLRIHKASVRRIIKGISNKAEGASFSSPDQSQKLLMRLDDAFQLLEYYEVTACSLLDQQQNLLSLAFNTETVSQGQAFARLNALAFIFLPLSFATGVFGMTTFTTDVKYYPALALPLLIATISAAFVANAIFARREAKPLKNDIILTSIKSAGNDRLFNLLEIWQKPKAVEPTLLQSHNAYAEGGLEDVEMVGAITHETYSSVPYGMSPAYGLVGSSGTGYQQLEEQAEPTGQRQSARYAASWVEADDAIGAHPVISNHNIYRSSASATNRKPLPPKSNAGSSRRLGIIASPPMDHTTLETILEQSPPLARNGPSANLAHFGNENEQRHEDG